MSSFHVRDQSGQQFGPCSPGELRAWIAEGRVTADMVVQQVGKSGWYRVGSVPALSSAIAQRVATEQSRQPAKVAPPEDAEVKYFFVTGSGAVEGPLLLGEIAGAVASGRIPRDAQLCVQGHDEWFPIARVLGEVSCISSQSQTAGTNVAHVVDGMTRYWVQGANSQAYGPYDLATIRTYLAEGRLQSDCQACVVGESHWRPISVVLDVSTPSAYAQPNINKRADDENEISKFSILGWFGWLCYCFGFIDFAAWVCFGYDLTGVFWSPIVAFVVGRVLMGIGDPDKEADSKQ